MKRSLSQYFFICIFSFLTFNCTSKVPYGFSERNITSTMKVGNGVKFSLKPGDILVRPNLNWLPGSSEVDSGRNFGHAAIVITGAEGTTVEEVMNKATVVEAYLFDQATRRFVFGSKNQVRKVPAIIPFGNRFRGIRYRLRMSLTEDQINAIVKFTNEQIGIGDYTFLSLKTPLLRFIANRNKEQDQICNKWHCASFVWFAYYDLAGIDLDSNGGECIFPNDLINAKIFDQPEGRLRF
jgi:hypothetical protein